MLSKHRCPHTGIVNYFATSEPFFSVGSIAAVRVAKGEFHWRIYDASNVISGIAKDMRTAEQRVEQELRLKMLHSN